MSHILVHTIEGTRNLVGVKSLVLSTLEWVGVLCPYLLHRTPSRDIVIFEFPTTNHRITVVTDAKLLTAFTICIRFVVGSQVDDLP